MKNKKMRIPRRSCTTKQPLLRVRKSEITEHKKHVSYKPPIEIHKHLYKQLEKNIVDINSEIENYTFQFQSFNLKKNGADQFKNSNLVADNTISSNAFNLSEVSSKIPFYKVQQQNILPKKEFNKNKQIQNNKFNYKKDNQIILAHQKAPTGYAHVQQSQKATAEHSLKNNFRNLNNETKTRKRQALESERRDYESTNRNSIIPVVDRNGVYCGCTDCASAAALTYHNCFVNKLSLMQKFQLNNQYNKNHHQFVFQPQQALPKQSWLGSKVPVPSTAHNCYSSYLAENAKRLCLSHVRKSGEYSFSSKQNSTFLQGHETSANVAQRQGYHMLNSGCYESSFYNKIDYKQLVLNQVMAAKSSQSKLQQKNPVLYQWSTSSLESRNSESIQGSSGLITQYSPESKSILSNNFDYSTSNLFLQNHPVVV